MLSDLERCRKGGLGCAFQNWLVLGSLSLLSSNVLRDHV